MTQAQNPHTIAFAHSWSKKMTVEEKRELESLIKELQRNGASLKRRHSRGGVFGSGRSNEPK